MDCLSGLVLNPPSSWHLRCSSWGIFIPSPTGRFLRFRYWYETRKLSKVFEIAYSNYHLRALVSLNVKELVSEAVSPRRVELMIRIWSLKPNFLISCFRSKPSSSCISIKGDCWCPAEMSRALFLKFGFFQQTTQLKITVKSDLHMSKTRQTRTSFLTARGVPPSRSSQMTSSLVQLSPETESNTSPIGSSWA